MRLYELQIEKVEKPKTNKKWEKIQICYQREQNVMFPSVTVKTPSPHRHSYYSRHSSLPVVVIFCKVYPIGNTYRPPNPPTSGELIHLSYNLVSVSFPGPIPLIYAYIVNYMSSFLFFVCVELGPSPSPSLFVVLFLLV